MKGRQQARKIIDAQMSGTLPRDTEERILSWLARYGDHPEYVDVLEERWNEDVSFHPEDTAESEERLERYKKRLGFPEEYAAETETVNRICAGIKKNRPLGAAHGMLLRIAAVLIPALCLVGAAWYITKEREMPVEHRLTANMRTRPLPVTEEEEVITEPKTVDEEPPKTEEHANEIDTYDIRVSALAGGHRYVRLSDQSTVLINGGGQIAYSTARREVYLTGEAFFKVTRGGDLPFRVKTDDLMVSVTGTEFNVEAWPDSGRTFVELIEGSVDIYMKGNSTSLTPLKEFILNRNTGSTRISTADAAGWWKDPIVFDNETLNQILTKIEQYYGIRVSGKEQIGGHVRYTIKFDKMSSPELIMDVMNELIADAQKEGSSQFEYTREGDGFTVKKIVTD